MRPGKRMHSPSLTSPRPNLWSSFTFWTHCLAVPCLWSVQALYAHSTDTEQDLIGKDRKYKHHRRVQQERERGRERGHKYNLHNMQGVLKHLTSCQEKVPDFVSGTNLTWQGSDSLAAADRTRQVHPDTFPFPHIHCRPLFHSLPAHIRLSSQLVPFVCFFLVYYLSCLMCCFCGVMLPAQRDNNITTDPYRSYSIGRQKPLCSVSENDVLGVVKLYPL